MQLIKIQKIITLFLLAFVLAACSSNPPPRPEPIGAFTAVNPSQINIHALMQ